MESKNSKVGYDIEELYFEKLNRELINNIKKQTGTVNTSDESEHQGAEILEFKRPAKEKKAA